MMAFSSVSDLVLNWLTNSSALEKAIWLMYFSTSSAVIPTPRSVIERIFLSLFTFTWMVRSPSLPLNLPSDARVFSFCEASTALEINSRRKISCSEYKNFFMMGKIFSVWTLIFPVCIIYLVYSLFSPDFDKDNAMTHILTF